MKKSGNMFIENLPYFCLIGVVALGLMTIVGTGGGDRRGGDPMTQEGTKRKLAGGGR